MTIKKQQGQEDAKDEEEHSKTYIALVSCQPYKKSSLPPLKCKLEEQKNEFLAFLELDKTGIDGKYV